MNTKNLPLNAFQFYAPAVFNPEAEASAERKLTGVAYSGDVVTDHGYWSNLVIDLASLSVATPIPLLCCHDAEDTVGVVTSTNTDGNALNIEARLFADVDDDAAEIAAKADKGFPWQLSVGIWPTSIESVQPGATIQLNGRTFTGPLDVFRGGRVREVSVVAIGADSKTSATVLSGGRDSFEIPFTTFEGNMNIDQLKTRVAELEGELTAANAKVIELGAAQPDPAKFVSFEAFQALQTELTALREKEHGRAVDELVQPALLDGRLLPAQEQWARDLGRTNLEALQAFMATTSPKAALMGTQTGGRAPESAPVSTGVKLAAGCEMSLDRAELHAKISEYQSTHGVDYITAARAIGA